jgi:two-component system, sporulation sensor kinase E
MRKKPSPNSLDPALDQQASRDSKLPDIEQELQAVLMATATLYLQLDDKGTVLSYKAGSSQAPSILPGILVGKSIQPLFPPALGHQFIESISQTLQQQTLIHLPYILKLAAQEQSFDAKFIPLSRSRVAVIIGNATDLKDVDERFASCGQLAAMGEITAGVAHELNNPLSVILGFSESLAREYNQGTLSTSLKSMEREALRCKRLVQNLLGFCRTPKAGKMPENLIHVIEDALALVEIQSRIKRVQLIRHLPEELPACLANRQQIQQMVINLCINSLDAMPNGGTLTVELKQIPNAPEKELIEISVTDTGAGIPLEIQDRIFEPFFTTKEVGKGTGLGLSLVQKIVNDHHGQIQVRSEAGKSTVFSIRLPTLSEEMSQTLPVTLPPHKS